MVKCVLNVTSTRVTVLQMRWGQAPRNRSSGSDFKQPLGAIAQSYGIERKGKGYSVRPVGTHTVRTPGGSLSPDWWCNYTRNLHRSSLWRRFRQEISVISRPGRGWSPVCRCFRMHSYVCPAMGSTRDKRPESCCMHWYMHLLKVLKTGKNFSVLHKCFMRSPCTAVPWSLISVRSRTPAWEGWNRPVRWRGLLPPSLATGAFRLLSFCTRGRIRRFVIWIFG